MRDACEDRRRFDALKIPSKASTPQLDRFLTTVREIASSGPPLALLDVGCGIGRLGRRLYDQGFSVLGVDVNPDAVRAAQEPAVPAAAPGRSLRFFEGDFAVDHRPRIAGGPFDVVVCQLVLSIIGAARQRTRRLTSTTRRAAWAPRIAHARLELSQRA